MEDYNMTDIKISRALEMQRELWEANKDQWHPLEPEFAKLSFLWMMEEVGECIAIIKKKGDDAIMNDPEVRKHFVEEMVDINMYLAQIMLRFNISPEEFATTFEEKHHKNMNRNYKKEYKDK